MTTATDAKSPDGTDTGALQRIANAAYALQSTKATGQADAISTAQADLHTAVRAANDLGISWQCIGEVLGVARGNAYQRYRRRKASDGDR